MKILNIKSFLSILDFTDKFLDGQCIVSHKGFQHVILKWPSFFVPPFPHNSVAGRRMYEL